MDLIVHKYHVANGHTARWFKTKEEARKEVARIIRRQCKAYIKANEGINKATNIAMVWECQDIQKLLNDKKYQQALFDYNLVMGHELTIKLQLDMTPRFDEPRILWLRKN